MDTLATPFSDHGQAGASAKRRATNPAPLFPGAGSLSMRLLGLLESVAPRPRSFSYPQLCGSNHALDRERNARIGGRVLGDALGIPPAPFSCFNAASG